MQEEYNKYIEEVCNCFEDCECMSLGKFMDKALEDIADRYDDFIEEYPEGAYA